MSLTNLLEQRLYNCGPIKVGLIGAGKFGSLFLAQVPTSPGIEVTAIADLDLQRARKTCADVGWEEESITRIRFYEDGLPLISSSDVEIVVEATGSPAAGVSHARATIREGKHIIMVNVEADVLMGPILAREAKKSGVVYSMAYGDQPALTCELVDWARSCGFNVIAAGKGTKYLPSYHTSTPDTVWDNYGLTPEKAASAKMNAQMFNSFLDGTKSAIEMAAIANATGLTPAPEGLGFPPCSTSDLAKTLRPREEGGQLHHKGQVEVVSSLNRDGQEIPQHLRWGVYVVVEAPNKYTTHCFQEYGIPTDPTGQYGAIHKPFHLVGLELNISILSAVLRNEPTGRTSGFQGDVVAIAKRNLAKNEKLDGEGGFMVWGRLMPAEDSLKSGALPIGLAHGLRLIKEVRKGKPVCWSDIDPNNVDDAFHLRKEMDNTFRSEWNLTNNLSEKS